MHTFCCDRCPLVLQIGSCSTWHGEQVVCMSCGTMHRLEFQHKGCRVLALPGPVRQLPQAKILDANGIEFEDHRYSWTNWQEVGCIDNINEFVRLACSHCGATGRLVTFSWPQDAEGKPVFRKQCPLCSEPFRRSYHVIIN